MKKLMKANILMDQMFDIQSNKICNDVIDLMDMSDIPLESIGDLILQFCTYKFSRFIRSVVTWLKPGHVPLIASQDFC